MKTLWIVLGISVVGLGGWKLLASSTKTPLTTVRFGEVQALSDQSPVIVELFTSEGCSSCPPADKLLSALITDPATYGKEIIALSFHVDYWNSLGWKDPFSSSAFSERQRTYARKLGSGVYTPQMVVNGKTEAVGSDRTKVSALISAARNHPGTHSVSFSTTFSEDNQTINVAWEVSGDLKGQVLQLALVEKGLDVAVGRGENGGRSLHHDQVVRKFVTLDLQKAEGRGTTEIQIPTAVNRKNAALVGYVQDQASWAISGAKQAGLPL